ncbi:efflux RND transporter periplasmic adaptor subunit [Clostridia bacterium OttesenSCG-928-F22]|nr:efflux RND transporter periplasmic adaptor subunit [Clostridia bacterium OttesenSCG-928-F22]
MKKKHIITISIFLVIAVALITSWPKNKAQIEMVSVQKGVFSKSIVTTGVVDVPESEKVKVPYTGIVSEVFVQAGSVVKQGDALFSMSTKTLEEELLQAKLDYEMLKNADVAASGKQSTDSLNEYLAMAQLYGVDYNIYNELIRQRINQGQAVSAEANNTLLQLANQKVGAIEEKLEQATVKAKSGGRVDVLQIASGQVAQGDNDALHIKNSGRYVIKANVNERDMQYIQAGQQVSITSSTAEGEEWQGSVIFKDARVSRGITDEATGRVDILPVDFTGMLGASTKLSIEYFRKEDALQLPMECLIEQDEESYVIVEQNGIACLKRVEIGQTDGYSMEVIAGLSEGDMVVKYPQHIKEGEALN